jgi:hypothetical protein
MCAAVPYPKQEAGVCRVHMHAFKSVMACPAEGIV